MEAPESNPEQRRASPLDVSVIRGAGRRYGPTLDKTMRSAVIPYGYTVTVWASGAYLINLRGVPGMWEAFAFVTGAMAAFGVLSWISQHSQAAVEMTTRAVPPDSSRPIFAAGLHIAAVGCAFAAATLVDSLLGEAAWFFGSFSVTLIYLSIATAELAIAVELSQRDIGVERARIIARRQRARIRRAVWRR